MDICMIYVRMHIHTYIDSYTHMWRMYVHSYIHPSVYEYMTNLRSSLGRFHSSSPFSSVLCLAINCLSRPLLYKKEEICFNSLKFHELNLANSYSLLFLSVYAHEYTSRKFRIHKTRFPLTHTRTFKYTQMHNAI